MLGFVVGLLDNGDSSSPPPSTGDSVELTLRASSGALPVASLDDDVLDVLRTRLKGLGVGKPDVRSTEGTIVVRVPRAHDTDRTRRLLTQRGQLLFRPVLRDLTPEGTTPSAEPTTPPEQNDEKAQVVLPERDGKGNVTARYALGPAEVRGQAISSAQAEIDTTTDAWGVTFSLTPEGTSAWNVMAQKVGQGGRIAIDLDGIVKSAPSLQTTDFAGSGQITGNFTEWEAKDLAVTLRSKSLAVELVVLPILPVGRWEGQCNSIIVTADFRGDGTYIFQDGETGTYSFNTTNGQILLEGSAGTGALQYAAKDGTLVLSGGPTNAAPCSLNRTGS